MNNIKTIVETVEQIKQNSVIPYKKICARVSIKGSKQHYTEARLVQLLEEKGIGRPSTFSSLVDKIQERGYVKKEDIKGRELLCKDYELENDEICEIETKREFGNEKGKLVLQSLGRVVMEFLEKHFDDLFNYNYTSLMEDALDKISKGEHIWHELCNKCNKEFTRKDNLIRHELTCNKQKINYRQENEILKEKLEKQSEEIKEVKSMLMDLMNKNAKIHPGSKNHEALDFV